MRGLLTFILVLAVVFFAVGETRGWYLGVAAQTPIFLYKKDHTADTVRRTVTRTDMPVRFSGDVKRGSVTMQVRYQQPSSFQTSQAAGAEQVIFEETWRSGQRALIDRVFERGGGVYTVVLTYQDATGLFKLELPGGVDL